MSLKPIAPKHRAKRSVRPVGAPVVVVQKKSGSGGLMMGIILLAAAAGGYFVYNNQQKNEAALAAKQERLEQNARNQAENERLKAEHEAEKARKKAERAAARTTAMGTVSTPEPTASAPVAAAEESPADDSPVAEEEEEGTKSAMGSTSAPTAGDGVFKVEDTSPPPFDLTAKGKAAQKVTAALDKAIDKAGDGNTYHDLQADLKRSFEVAQPGLFADSNTLPAFPEKSEKLLRYAQGVYVCLTIAAELESQATVPDKEHAKFVNWLMKEKAKPARTFTYGLEHYSISDMATATKALNELRSAYLIAPSSAEGKIKPVLEAAAK